MRGLIVLCLIAIACADQPGYNYHPVGHSSAGLSFSPGASGSSGSAIASPSISAPVGAPSSLGPSAVAGPVETNKEFYSFTAPEHEFDDAGATQEATNSLKRNLRVVFIRAPENRGAEEAALSLARQSSNDRTAIYVLSRQADVGDLANKLNAIRNSNSNRPEVHFVKYRTPEDANNAQNTIQSQYDSLGGPSQSHNGGVAPVLNFASQSAPVQVSAPQVPSSAYLPSSVLRRLRF